MAGIATLCPNDHHHSSTKEPNRYHSNFAIVVTVIDEVESLPIKYFCSVVEIDLPLDKRPPALPRIVGDLHRSNNVYTINIVRKAGEQA